MACPKIHWYRPSSALDFAVANHRPELKLGKSVSQSAVRLQMMSHHMSKSCEILPSPSDFHDTLLAYGTFHFNCTSYNFLLHFSKSNSKTRRLHLWFHWILSRRSWPHLKFSVIYKIWKTDMFPAFFAFINGTTGTRVNRILFSCPPSKFFYCWSWTFLQGQGCDLRSRVSF